MTGSIYVLIDPFTNLVRYVGQTKNKPKSRYFQHKYQWKRSKGLISHVNCWIKSLYEKGSFPILEVVETNILLQDLNNKEIVYILLFKSFGARLTNVSAGGGVYISYTQKETWKEKRLETLKTSVAWKERNIRHSEILKDLHKDENNKIGFKGLSKEAKLLLKEKAIKATLKPVELINTNDDLIKSFISIKEAADYFKINPTHITKLCKGKNKSGLTYGLKFRYKAKSN